MPTSNGWIKIHRKMLDSVVMTDPVLCHVWVQLLLRANFERRQLLTGQWLEPGQLVIGQEKFSLDIGIGRQQVRRCVLVLEKCGNLTSKPTSRGTVITITNWAKYQLFEDDQPNSQPANQPEANQKPTRSQPQNDNNKNDENGRTKISNFSTKNSHPKTGFGEWWNCVKRKVGKENARKAYDRAVARVRKDRDCSPAEAGAYLIDRMKAWAASPAAADDVLGSLHPATWLNQGRYDDDPTAWAQVRNPYKPGSEAAEQHQRESAARTREEKRRAAEARRKKAAAQFEENERQWELRKLANEEMRNV